jgi:Pectate lyase superfamily protein
MGYPSVAVVKRTKGYGADPSGVGDSRAAIQNAINALPARGGIVQFPPGDFKVTDDISYIHSACPTDGNSGFIILRGAGIGNTRIRGTSLGKPIFKSKDSAVRFFRVAFEDMEIDNTSSGAGGGVGIDFTNISDSLIKNVRIVNVETGLFARERAYYNTILQLLVQTVVTGIDLGKASGATFPVTEWNFYGGKVLDSTTAIKIVTLAAGGNLITNLKFHAINLETFTTGVDIGESKGCQFIGNRIEGGTNGFLIDALAENIAILFPHFASVTTPLPASLPSTKMIIYDGRIITGEVTLTNNSTTPSVARSNAFLANNSSGTTITNFTGGVNGQRITIFAQNGNTTIQHNGTTIFTKTAANVVMAANQTIEFIKRGTPWFEV